MATSTLTVKRLSPHFSLHELLASQTATRKNISEQFDPPEHIIDNLYFLSNHLLEKLRKINGNHPLFISSGYRCERLNKAVGGARTSQHIQGQAADIDFGSKVANKAFFNRVKSSSLEFDQLLNEYDFEWIHISLRRKDNRGQILNIP